MLPPTTFTNWLKDHYFVGLVGVGSWRCLQVGSVMLARGVGDAREGGQQCSRGGSAMLTRGVGNAQEGVSNAHEGSW